VEDVLGGVDWVLEFAEGEVSFAPAFMPGPEAESIGIAGAGIFAATGALVGPAVAVTLAESVLSLATSAMVLSALLDGRSPRGEVNGRDGPIVAAVPLAAAILPADLSL
jgi:hypothetical protein